MELLFYQMNYHLKYIITKNEKLYYIILYYIIL